jgi:multidrug resistance efflux pump
LREVLVREGEPVKAGQVLARFETRDLMLQLSQVEQEYERSLLESDAALNAGNESQMQISRLKASQAAAVAEKLRADLDRAVIKAPFDGWVLGAQTLSTRLGEVLRMGEPMLQVIDPSAWQVKAAMRERDLVFLDERLRQNGPIPATLRLASNPAHTYRLELAASSQLAYGLDTSIGEYQFTAMLPLNAALDDSRYLKSGFTGQISFDAGKQPIAYVLFKDFINYITVRFF